METVAEVRARKALEDAEKARARAKLDAQAMQGSTETLERLKKEEEAQKTVKAK